MFQFDFLRLTFVCHVSGLCEHASVVLFSSFVPGRCFHDFMRSPWNLVQVLKFYKVLLSVCESFGQKNTENHFNKSVQQVRGTKSAVSRPFKLVEFGLLRNDE